MAQECKMKIAHPDYAHMKENNQIKQEIPVHTVMTPEDEAAKLASEMRQLESSLEEDVINQPDDDPVLKREQEKKEIFEKLVLFKEPAYKTFKFSGVAFRLKLLTSAENAMVIAYLNRLNVDERTGKLGLMTLAASLTDIGSIPLEDMYTGAEDLSSPMLRRYYEISQWNSAVTNTLIGLYSQFRLETEQEYTKDFLEE